MKQIIEDNKIAEEEAKRIEIEKNKKEAQEKALQEFRNSSYRAYVLQYFEEYEQQIEGEVQRLQGEDMKQVFMLSAIKQKEKIAEMSKRDAILTGVLSIIKKVKRKL